MNKLETFSLVVCAILVTILLLGLGSCGYNLSVDNRDRKQQKIDQCLENGFGGAIQLSDGSSWVCVGGATDAK